MEDRYRFHLQQSVGKEMDKLIKQGHIENANNINENCFVSPAVIAVKKDKLEKTALDSEKLNEITIKRGPRCLVWRN